MWLESSMRPVKIPKNTLSNQRSWISIYFAISKIE
jgi:hypothetical protein